MLFGLSIKVGEIKLKKKNYLMQVCLQWNVSLKTRKTTVGWLQSWKKDIKVSYSFKTVKLNQIESLLF